MSAAASATSPEPVDPQALQHGLTLVTAAATATAVKQVSDDPQQTAAALAVAGPLIVEQFGGAAATLATDFYDATRSLAQATQRYTAKPVVDVRADYIIGNLAGWATDPLRADKPDIESTIARVADVIQLETARALRDTMTQNAEQDPAAVGWRRIARAGACPFCRMLADKGAIFKESTARFAAHTNCHCAAVPVFKGGDRGPEASVEQYVASRKRRTDAGRKQLRDYLAAHYGDS